jgi:hypothetical protein
MEDPQCRGEDRPGWRCHVRFYYRTTDAEELFAALAGHGADAVVRELLSTKKPREWFERNCAVLSLEPTPEAWGSFQAELAADVREYCDALPKGVPTLYVREQPTFPRPLPPRPKHAGGRPRKVTPDIEAKVLALRGTPILKICAQVRLGYGTVHRILRAHDL